jgi:hypothetical protein
VQILLVNIFTRELIEALRTVHIDVINKNIAAHGWARAHKRANDGIVVAAGGAGHVFDVNIRYC